MENIVLEDRPRRSEDLTPDERKALNTWVKKCKTKLDAAYNLGISRVALTNTLARGSAKPSTVQAIRRVVLGQSIAA